MTNSNSENPGCWGWILGLFNPVEAVEDDGIAFHHYTSTNTIFDSKTEGTFYAALIKIVGDKLVVMAQVGMEAVINVKRDAPSNVAFGLRQRINSRRIDFLLCDPGTLKPRLAIELDGKGHNSEKQRGQDAIRDKTFAAAGVPLLRVKVAKTYDLQEVAGEIKRALSGEGHTT